MLGFRRTVRFVSPGWVKTCRLVITREEPNNNSTGSIAAICAQLMTSADLCKSGVLPLGNLRSIR